MSTILRDNIAFDTTQSDRLVGDTVRAMRHSLGITVAQLAKASGMPDSTLEAIESGGRTTRGERHDIAVAVAWLADNRVAKGT